MQHVVFLQAQAFVDHVTAIRQMELISVPRADDVHVILIESLAEIAAVLADQIDHLRHAQPLARRSALMRAQIAIGVIFSGVMDDADLDRPGLDHPHAAVGNLAFLANQYLSHLLARPFYIAASYDSAPPSSATIG